MAQLPTRTRQTIRCALTIVGAAGLSACGGGGDSGTSPNGAFPITSTNATSVARAGLSGLQSGELAGTADEGLVGPTALQAGIAQTRRAEALVARVLAGGRARPQATVTLNCAGGGTLTVTFTDSNNNGWLDAQGESISLSASNCNDGDGAVLTGSFALTLVRYTNATHYAYDLKFTAFEATDIVAATTAYANGILAVTRNGLGNAAVHADTIETAVRAAGVKHSYTVTDFDVTVIGTVDSLTQSLTGRFSGGDYGVRWVQVTTPTPVVRLAGDDHPTTGALLFKGASNSALQVEAIDDTQAKLSIDADGDGVYEATRVVSWTELD